MLDPAIEPRQPRQRPLAGHDNRQPYERLKEHPDEDLRQEFRHRETREASVLDHRNCQIAIPSPKHSVSAAWRAMARAARTKPLTLGDRRPGGSGTRIAPIPVIPGCKACFPAIKTGSV